MINTSSLRRFNKVCCYRFKSMLLLGVMLCCLSGCIDSSGIFALSSPLDEAQLVTDEHIEHAEEQPDWPSQQWWLAYGDPQLNHWVDKALAHNHELAKATARIREAEALAGVAEGVEAPQSDFDVSVSRKRWPDDQFYGATGLGRSTTWNNSSDLDFSYDLDLWGHLRKDRERRLSLTQVAATEQRAVALSIEKHVVQTYINLALAHEHLDIAEAELADREELLEMVRTRLANGLSTQFELSEAAAPIPEAHREVDLMQEEIALLKNKLSILAGGGPGEGAELTRPQLTLEVEPGLPSALPMELVGHRPDVVARRWAVVAEARDMDVAKADFYPNVDLVASFGTILSNGSLLSFVSMSKRTYSFGPAFSLPIFDGGVRRGRLEEKTARYDQAVESYNQTVVEALNHISDQLIRLHSLHEQHGFIQTSVETAQRRYELAQEAYHRGLTDYRDVLAAQDWLYEKRRTQESIHAEQLSVQCELWVQLGGGMMTAEDSPKPAEMQSEQLTVTGWKPAEKTH